MTSKAEKDIVLYYLNNLLKQSFFGDVERQLCDWFEEIAPELLGLDIESFWEDRRPWRRESEPDERAAPRSYKTMRTFLEDQPGRLTHSREVSAMIEAFHISPQYRDIFTLRIYAATIPMLTTLVESHNPVFSRKFLASMAEISVERYDSFFSPHSELVEKGLFETTHRRGWDTDMTDTLKDVLFSHCKTPKAVKKTILGKPQKATLRPEHFEHVADEYAWLKTLLTNALKKKERGVNVLLYGKPGTGKTELAKTLCREIDAQIFSVSGQHAEERNGCGRRYDLAAAMCLLRGDENTVLLMDEAEDVFENNMSLEDLFGFGSHRPARSKSKLFFNKLLENNEIPVIWISNSIRNVDAAHLRRFSYAMNMELPDETVQARIWDFSAKKHKVTLPKERVDELVRSFDIAPAIIDASLRTAALTDDTDAIEKTVESLQTAMYGQSKRRDHQPAIEFSTHLLHCDIDMEKLTGQVLKMKSRKFSLCLYGAPGTGKSAYARYLAKQLGMKVLHKRASDLLGPYVGMTEYFISQAFAEARRKNQLLVLDEADSFLQERRHARQSWEVTQVNEMLTQMESHPLPFVCTTNLMDGLDQASLRRFTFKVKYDFLKPEQVAEAFGHFFGEESRVPLTGLSHLTPGDFAVVANRMEILDVDDHAELVDMLRQEQDVKDVKNNRVGFV